MKIMKKVARNLDETAKIAKQILELFLERASGEKALVLSLSGDLGAGKTALTQAIAQHLGVTEKVNSPTFVLMKKYALKNQPHQNLYHLDAYRFEKEQELLNLGWSEIVENKDNLVIIEWPEKVAGVMPAETFEIKIFSGEDESRIFEFE